MSQSRPCDTCGESEYYEDGGFFYCQECNTQSQGMRLIEASTDQFNLSGGQRSIYQKVDRKIGEKEKEEADFGIPWTTHDAFALLVQAQSVELVKLGAPPSFPLLVEKLWKRYQSRRSGTPLPRARDVATDRSKGVAPVSQWRAFRQRTGKWPSTVDAEHLSAAERKEWKMQNGVEEEQAEEEERQREEEKKEEKREKKRARRKGEGEEEEQARSEGGVEDDGLVERDTQPVLGIARNTAYAHIQRMRMEYSLCFLYIALLHLESHITLGDLCRWSERCYIPYLNPTDFFPENMKFSDFDSKTFARVKRVPSPAQIRTDAGRLIVHLQLNPFPAVDIQRLISRFVTDLDLPVAVLKVASGLLTRLNIVSPTHAPRKDDRGRPLAVAIPNYEAIAVTVLLMSLKLIFRLDGVTEFVLSHLVDELDRCKHATGDASSASVGVFRFKDWFQFCADAVLRLRSRQFPSWESVASKEGDANGGIPRDVAYLARFYKHNIVNRKGSEKAEQRLPPSSLVDCLQDSLADLLLRDADLSSPQTSAAPTSFPVLAAAERDGVFSLDDAAETEWRRNFGGGGGGSSCGDGGRGEVGNAAHRKLSERSLGILMDPPAQRDLVKNELLLLKLKLPAYEIDDETGFARCEWVTSEGAVDVSQRLENRRNCLENLFSHQSRYCLIVERDEAKERIREGTIGPEKRRSNQVKDAVFRTSSTVGVIVDLCALMVAQDRRQLLIDINQIESEYPLWRSD